MVNFSPNQRKKHTVFLAGMEDSPWIKHSNKFTRLTKHELIQGWWIRQRFDQWNCEFLVHAKFVRCYAQIAVLRICHPTLDDVFKLSRAQLFAILCGHRLWNSAVQQVQRSNILEFLWWQQSVHPEPMWALRPPRAGS